MKHSRFTKQQIIGILTEQEAGTNAGDVCRHGISDATFYKWKAKYGGMEISELDFALFGRFGGSGADPEEILGRDEGERFVERQDDRSEVAGRCPGVASAPVQMHRIIAIGGL